MPRKVITTSLFFVITLFGLRGCAQDLPTCDPDPWLLLNLFLPIEM